MKKETDSTAVGPGPEGGVLVVDGPSSAVDASTPWDQLVRDHADRVYRLAYRLTGTPYAAEDLTQDVFIRVFRSHESFTAGHFDGWLHRITVNRFLDQVRRDGCLKMEPLRDEADYRQPAARGEPEQVVMDRVLDEDISIALAALPPGYRVTVLLSDIAGLTYDEIAALLGLKRGTVGSRIHRARALLRVTLAHRGPSTARPVASRKPDAAPRAVA